jgi:hypothetical protein
MICATDEQTDAEPEFISLGRFEPPDAKRILRRLEEEHILFRVDAPGEVHLTQSLAESDSTGL